LRLAKHSPKKFIAKAAILAFAACLLFAACEDVIFNDLALQGEWEKRCEVDYDTKLMRIKIDSDNFSWKEADEDDWSETFSCSASFGVLILKRPDGTIRGSYTVFWTKVLFTGWTWDDGFFWLNGTWDKQ
jgi:hypothetical protein